jgi:anti-anti-sigma regulatory factor
MLPVSEENTMLKISFSETPAEEKWILEGRLSGAWVRELRASWKKNHQTDKKRACIVDLNEVTFIDKTGERLLRALRNEGAQFISGGCYVRHIVERLKVRRKRKISNLLASFLVVFVLVLFDTGATRAQSATVLGSVPSGPATDQVVHLTLRDAVNTALRYNLGAIESGQNAQIARGQRLLALSNLLPQVSVGASENVQQVNLATFGLYQQLDALRTLRREVRRDLLAEKREKLQLLERCFSFASTCCCSENFHQAATLDSSVTL